MHDRHPRPQSIGVIGLGAMGAPMAGRLLDHVNAYGGKLWLFSRTRQKAVSLLRDGAEWADTPAEMATRCDVVLVILPSLDDFERMLDGPDGFIAGVRNDVTLIVSSTCSPEGVRELGARLGTQTDGRATVVDAPVSGGVEGAKRGTLSIMVGSSPAAPIQPVLELLGSLGTAVRLGPLGAGQVAKSCNQIIVAANAMALAEASIIAERAGIDLALLLPMLSRGYASSRLLEAKLDRFIRKRYEPDGKAVYMVKDLTFAWEEGRNLNAYTPLLEGLLQEYIRLVDGGLGELDLAVTQKHIASMSPAPPPLG